MCLLVIRDVRERGRDIEGCVKQWFAFVKPNFEKVTCPSSPGRYFPFCTACLFQS